MKVLFPLVKPYVKFFRIRLSDHHYQNLAGFDLAKISAVGGIGVSGLANGQNGTVHTQQQTASLSPEIFDAPRMGDGGQT